MDPPQQGNTSSYCQKENGSSPWSDQCSLKTLEPSRPIPTYTMEYLKDPKTFNISQWLKRDTRNLYLCPCQSLQTMSTMTGQKSRHDANGCLEPPTNNNSFSFTRRRTCKHSRRHLQGEPSWSVPCTRFVIAITTIHLLKPRPRPSNYTQKMVKVLKLWDWPSFLKLQTEGQR